MVFLTNSEDIKLNRLPASPHTVVLEAAWDANKPHNQEVESLLKDHRSHIYESVCHTAVFVHEWFIALVPQSYDSFLIGKTGTDAILSGFVMLKKVCGGEQKGKFTEYLKKQGRGRQIQNYCTQK